MSDKQKFYCDIKLSDALSEKDGDGRRWITVLPRGSYGKRTIFSKKVKWTADDKLFDQFIRLHDEMLEKFGEDSAKLPSDYNHALDSHSVNHEDCVASGHTFKLRKSEEGLQALHRFTPRAESYIEAGEYDRISSVFNPVGRINDQGDFVKEPEFKGFSLLNRPFHKNLPVVRLTESNSQAIIYSAKENFDENQGDSNNMENITLSADEYRKQIADIETLRKERDALIEEKAGKVLLSEDDANELEDLRKFKSDVEKKEKDLKLSEAKLEVDKLVEAGTIQKSEGEVFENLYLNDRQSYDKLIEARGGKPVVPINQRAGSTSADRDTDTAGVGTDGEGDPEKAYIQLCEKIKKEKEVKWSEAELILRDEHPQVHEAYYRSIFA